MAPRKLLLCILTAAFICLSSMHSTGAGFQLGFFPALTVNQDGIKSENFEANVTGTIRCTRIPLVFGTGLTAGSDKGQANFGLSAFADWWISDIQIENNWNFYSGFGASGILKFSSEEMALTVGPRFFAGSNWLFLDNFLEFYIQQNIVPSLNYNFNDKSEIFRLYLPFEVGLRFHF